MAIDPSSIATGIATHYATKATDKVILPQEDSSAPPLVSAITPIGAESFYNLLVDIRNALSPKEVQNLNFPMALQPYPYEYVIDEQWFGRAHLCIFFQNSTSLHFDIEGVGTYFKTVGPGWVQCDVRGRISTTDINHNVIVSYRVDAIGSAL